MSSGPGTDESDLDLGLPPDIFLSPFHRSPSDVSSGQDVDARASALSVPQYLPPEPDDVMEALLDLTEAGVPGASAAPGVVEPVVVQSVPADSTSDEEVEEIPASLLPGSLTVDDIVAFVGDHADLSWRDVNAVLLSRQVAGTVSPVQTDCLRLIIQSVIACEQSLWSRVVQAAQPLSGC
jgi:hypothetical protein